jgi:pyridoxine 5-phosphate synthase
MIRLNINIDHVATLRNQRDTEYPSVIRAAELCLSAGADGITVHLREDRRHIRDRDVAELRPLMPVEKILNLEMAATMEMVEIACRVRPTAVTLVPERREERTTEGGLDVVGQQSHLLEVARRLKGAGLKLSLFIEADRRQVEMSHQVGADQVEFHTGHYCDAPERDRAQLLPRFVEASELAHQLGLEVAAGHGLNAENVAPIARLPHMSELNIGHSVISDAVFVGMSEAVRRLSRAIHEAVR